MTWILLALGCSDYRLTGKDDVAGADDTGAYSDDTGNPNVPEACASENWPAEEVGLGDMCPDVTPGGFDPIVEWDHGNDGCLAQPVVADLDQDAKPDILYIHHSGLFTTGDGVLTALEGDGSGAKWSTSGINLANGSAPAVGDLDGDGVPEVIVVVEYASSLFGGGDYTLMALTNEGKPLWESDHFTGGEFDYATAPAISDMNHDGSPEVVAGRVIFNADGSTRGVGSHGRGSYSAFEIESSVSAIADLDLDGQEEVIVGNAAYDIDGNDVWFNADVGDGMVGIVNLDSDPEGEIVAVAGNTVRAMDTDGTLIWGPVPIPSGNILSTPAMADIDLDGMPEIVVAGGNELRAYNHDGTILWAANATDESGATGASIFDFEGDGQPEVVYIDELQMMAFDGLTGALKFYNADHASNTMFDYPVVADVDGDDHAEIVVCHNFHSSALSVYGDANDSWAPSRRVWNQHAYSISNVNDDATIPVDAVPNFSASNTWHSAIAVTGSALEADYEAEILNVCEDDCRTNTVYVTWRVRNRGVTELVAGTPVTLYAVEAGANRAVMTWELADTVQPGWASPGYEFTTTRDDLQYAEHLVLSVDDDGTGTGTVAECSETNNQYQWSGPFCR
jgi:hypothetical protein